MTGKFIRFSDICPRHFDFAFFLYHVLGIIVLNFWLAINGLYFSDSWAVWCWTSFSEIVGCNTSFWVRMVLISIFRCRKRFCCIDILTCGGNLPINSSLILVISQSWSDFEVQFLHNNEGCRAMLNLRGWFLLEGLI